VECFGPCCLNNKELKEGKLRGIIITKKAFASAGAFVLKGHKKAPRVAGAPYILKGQH
jgi:hypothetical protein